MRCSPDVFHPVVRIRLPYAHFRRVAANGPFVFLTRTTHVINRKSRLSSCPLVSTSIAGVVKKGNPRLRYPASLLPLAVREFTQPRTHPFDHPSGCSHWFDAQLRKEFHPHPEECSNERRREETGPKQPILAYNAAQMQG